METVIGIDLGTESARATVFSLKGEELSTATEILSTFYPRPGWAEQDPNEWWTAVKQAVGHARVLAPVGRVVGVGVASTASTVVLSDEAGCPLRPAILWMDQRASAEAAYTGTCSNPILKYSGGADAAEWLIPKAMWLAKWEPAVYRRAAKICEAVDYVTFKLTKVWSGSQLNASCKWNFDPVAGLPADLYRDLGIPDITEKLPAPILPVGEPVGHLDASVAEELGLDPQVTVATGGIDAHVSLLATGRVERGQVAISAGTSVAHIVQNDVPVFAKALWGPYPDALMQGMWLIEGGQVSAGSILRWLTSTMLKLDEKGVRKLIAEASDVSPGSGGLLALDFWMGNRTPYRDPQLRGAIFGLTLAHRPAELYRSCVEAIAYGTRNVLQSFEDAGVPVDTLTVSGGIRHNPLWVQITADVLGRSFGLVRAGNLATRGAAICGAVAARRYGSLREAAAAMAVDAATVEPEASSIDRYESGFALYGDAIRDATDTLHKLAGS